MEEHDIFNDWISNKKDINPPSEFSSNVMKRIKDFEENKGEEDLFNTLKEIDILPVRILRIVLALGVLILGLLRICYIPFSIFFPILAH